MAGKSSEGFTKSAQKTKFIRHRDVQMKGKELKKEAVIKKVMCEGVCKRCREKVLWRFKYDKYKPLKTPGKCQLCKNKTVTKAYRTLCDKCATSKQSCGSCCRNILEADASDAAESELNAINTKSLTEGQENEIIDHQTAMEEDEYVAEDSAEDNEEEGDSDEDSEGQMVDNSTKAEAHVMKTGSSVMGTEKELEQTEKNVSLAFESVWDERKFTNIAASKYSKSRAIVVTSLAPADSDV